MFQAVSVFVLLSAIFTQSYARVGFGPGEQEWGYETVRPGAKIFWWLHYTTANVTALHEKPLVIWLQGGPGASSTGYGNFELIGPLDINLNPRKYNWVNHYNILFIDSPVGTGFSFSTDNAFATTNRQIAEDLLVCVQNIFKKESILKKARTYIVGESYGGKTAIEFARIWHEAEQAGQIESRLSGVALGDAWISPIDSVMTWAPYLLQTGMIDDVGYGLIQGVANRTKEAVQNEAWEKATQLWDKTETIISHVTRNIDFYNILSKVKYFRDKTEKSVADKLLDYLMNSKVKSELNLTTTWGEQTSLVFKSHTSEFMKPVLNQVEYVLNNTDLNVFVYNGQLDLIVDTPGTLNWVNQLRWNYSRRWHYSDRKPLVIDNVIEGYVKKYNKFAMYWINRSGHMVPKDNPVAALKLINELTKS